MIWVVGGVVLGELGAEDPLGEVPLALGELAEVSLGGWTLLAMRILVLLHLVGQKGRHEGPLLAQLVPV